MGLSVLTQTLPAHIGAAVHLTGPGYLDDYTADAHQIHVVGEVVFHPYSDLLPEGGSWCYFYGPPATYNWKVTGSTLTLTPVGGHDPCGIRGYVWSGTWQRTR